MGNKRVQVNYKARTIVEISGTAIETIPVGTEFTIVWIDMENYIKDHENPFCPSYSVCTGLGISDIYNNEFEIV